MAERMGRQGDMRRWRDRDDGDLHLVGPEVNRRVRPSSALPGLCSSGVDRRVGVKGVDDWLWTCPLGLGGAQRPQAPSAILSRAKNLPAIHWGSGRRGSHP